MRKISAFFIAFLMAIVSINALAQEESGGGGAGLISIEVTASPFENTQAFLSPGFVRGKYFLGPIGIRLGFTASLYNNETDPTTIFHRGFFDLRPGGEYHFSMGKASPYAGAELIIQNQSSNKNSTSEIGVANATSESGANRAYFGYGTGLFTGVDYYWGENFYCGIEVGLEIMGRSYRGVEMAGEEVIEPTKSFIVNTNFSNFFKFGYNF